MKYFKRFESYFQDIDDLLPPPPVDTDDDGDSDGDDDSQRFKYDFKISGMRYNIKTTDDISEEINSLNYDSNKVVINKFKITHGYVCLKVKNFFTSGTSQYLMIEAYYSIEDGSSSDRLNVHEFCNDINEIIYNKIEYPFEFVNLSMYDNWKKVAWISL